MKQFTIRNGFRTQPPIDMSGLPWIWLSSADSLKLSTLYGQAKPRDYTSKAINCLPDFAKNCTNFATIIKRFCSIHPNSNLTPRQPMSR